MAQDQKEKGERPRDQALVLFKKAKTGDTNVQSGKWERGEGNEEKIDFKNSHDVY